MSFAGPHGLAAPAGWIVINSHPSQEHNALEHLARQGFRAYCPMILKRRAHARRIDHVKRPLFPGYLFVDADTGSGGWRPIMSTAGVKNVVRFGRDPAILGDHFISALRSREAGGLISIRETRYRIGQQVRLTGPFEGVVATILELDEKDRLTVLMDLLRRPVRAKINASEVTPL